VQPQPLGFYLPEKQANEIRNEREIFVSMIVYKKVTSFVNVKETKFRAGVAQLFRAHPCQG
jgi:hypothetical protein